MSAAEHTRATVHAVGRGVRRHGAGVGHGAGHSAWQIAGIAATVAVGVAVTSGGVYAALTADAFNAAPQTVSSGTLQLVLDSGGTTGFASIVDKLAPGDTVNRYIQVKNTGSLAGQGLTLKLVDAAPSVLTTDGTRGLQVTVRECAQAWTVVANVGSCGAAGGSTPALTATSAAALRTASPAALTSSTLPALTGVKYYQVSLNLPDTPNAETSVNGVVATPPPGGSIQGLTAALTWTFTMTQRAGTTTSA
jgi:spore coat-associated protein N